MRTLTGTREWSQHSANCCLGCSHGCLYCYARAAALRFKRISQPQEWTRERHLPLPKRIYKKRGVTMFPTNHDITPANLDHCLAYLLMLLHAGNRVLIVSKPHLGCIQRLCLILWPWQPMIEFRFTVGAITDEPLEFWEPGAPGVSERFASARAVMEAGYRLSISAEPLLQPDCAAMLVSLYARYAETIWIGKANKLRERTRWCLQPVDHGEQPPVYLHRLEEEIARIEAGQTDESVRQVYRELSDNPKIRWKDSYREVIERRGDG